MVAKLTLLFLGVVSTVWQIYFVHFPTASCNAFQTTVAKSSLVGWGLLVRFGNNQSPSPGIAKTTPFRSFSLSVGLLLESEKVGLATAEELTRQKEQLKATEARFVMTEFMIMNQL